jgi:hypothetical protein
MPFLVVCETSHNSSRLEIYGHVKLENPHECTIIQSEYKINYLNNKVNPEIRSGLTLKQRMWVKMVKR